MPYRNIENLIEKSTKKSLRNAIMTLGASELVCFGFSKENPYWGYPLGENVGKNAKWEVIAYAEISE